jgi:proprotein convertase subtilisin/kexin type 5
VCLNGFTCTNCSSGYLMYVGSCRKECPEGTFSFNSEQCFSCLSPCKTCSDTGDNCDSCLRGFVYFNHECKTDCDPGTFFADGSCLVCSSRCATCSGSSSSCTSCASGQYLYKDSCYSECPAAVVNGKCTDICPDGQYLDGNVCKDCASKCETCRNSATNCTRCADGYKSYDGECLQLCPVNTLDSGSFCLRCDPTCNGCESSIYNCVNCAQGLVKLNGQCVEGCPEGSFLNYATGSCEFCGTGCKMCHSATRCTDCFDATETPINGACQKTCPVGANLVNGECVCFFGVSHLGACVSSCPEGYFAMNGKCLACQSPCKDCVGSDSNCLSCREGFELDIQSRKCVKSNACPYGQALDGTCKRICGNGLFFHKTACIFICPIGYVDNGYGGCIQETSPSFCQPPQFQQGTSCRDSCLLGHYPNHFTRVCEKCPTGCLLCISAETCLQCNVGKILISGHCEDSIGCQSSQVQYKGRCEARCPVGTARDGNTCQAACEENTYFYDGVCYQTCPTGHHTPEACVNDCANYDRCE